MCLEEIKIKKWTINSCYKGNFHSSSRYLLAANRLRAEDFPEKNLPTTQALIGNGGKIGAAGGGLKRNIII